jgi:hypothetical protein
MSGRFPRTIIALIWVLAVLVSDREAAPQLSREYDLKAVFLLNFAQFVSWPAEAFPSPDAPFTIGVLGADPFRGTIDEVVQSEKVRKRAVVVERYDKVEEALGCQILFISTSELKRIPHALKVLRQRPILTVSELDNFAQRRGMIQFLTESSKVCLRINNEAAKAAGLTISTKLLRVAEVVTSAPAP